MVGHVRGLSGGASCHWFPDNRLVLQQHLATLCGRCTAGELPPRRLQSLPGEGRRRGALRVAADPGRRLAAEPGHDHVRPAVVGAAAPADLAADDQVRPPAGTSITVEPDSCAPLFPSSGMSGVQVVEMTGPSRGRGRAHPCLGHAVGLLLLVVVEVEELRRRADQVLALAPACTGLSSAVPARWVSDRQRCTAPRPSPLAAHWRRGSEDGAGSARSAPAPGREALACRCHPWRRGRRPLRAGVTLGARGSRRALRTTRVTLAPLGPRGPCAPVSPLAPLGPRGPCAPVSPLGPAGPGGPAGPCAPPAAETK